jgi:endoglucanase
VPVPNQGAVQQTIDLLRHGRPADAARIAKMVATPQAVWVTKGTPSEARKAVEKAVALANAQRAVAVLVAYNIPGRDCGGLSAGGALTTAEYKAWIDGFAAGIGRHKAVVILEPDGLGLIPSACGPAGEPGFTDAARFEEFNYAVDALAAKPNAIVYLDATHSAWLNVHDAASRLLRAGVQRARGFYLNASNYQYTPNLVQYGTWISKCIARLTANASAECPDQYWNGGPHPAHIADLLGEWTGVALSRYGVWSDTTDTPELNTSGENTRYADTTGTTHFVIDTSRNGLGPWSFPSTYANDAVAQDWCNPPGRGLGPRPAAAPVPSNPLVDAYLWVKIPGESDGQCTRGTAGPSDPEWGITDPAAGQWFPQQALELARLANPPLLR